jgi:SAM-dependent methyltransferase
MTDADVETSSAAYARRFEGRVGEWFLDVQARTTLELLRPRPGASVLDVGGGHAQLTAPLVAAGCDVTVYGSAESCGERVEEWVRTGRVHFRSGPLLQAPWPDASFDAVLAFRLLPHVGHWRELVAELCRLARHTVIVDYPTSRSANAISGALFGLKKGIERDPRPFRVFRDTEVEEALAAAGFARTARRPQFLFPMALHRVLRLAPLSRGLEAVAGVAGLTRAWGSPVILRAERRG